MISQFVYGYIMGWVSSLIGVASGLLMIYFALKYNIKKKTFGYTEVNRK